MNLELEKTIDSMLANGELSQRSRELLLNKAEELGVNLIDFELELEQKIATKKLSTSGPITIYTTSELKSNKEGDFKKCPSCGAPVQSFNTKCSECGHEFRNTDSTESIKEFYNLMKDASLEKQCAIITSYPIPNNKEDLIEFIALCISNSKSISHEERMAMMTNKGAFGHLMGGGNSDLIKKEAIISAWRNKGVNGLTKAKFIFANDNIMISQFITWEKELNLNINEKKVQEKKQFIGLLVFFVLFIAIVITLVHFSGSK